MKEDFNFGNFKEVKQYYVKNQFVVKTDKCTIFYSYYSKIVVIIKKQVYLDKEFWDYSKTTGKYRNRFLGESKKETEKKIKKGIYLLANLNER